MSLDPLSEKEWGFRFWGKEREWNNMEKITQGEKVLLSSEEEVREAHKRLLNKWRPDQFSDDPEFKENVNERLREINIVFENLISSMNQKKEGHQTTEKQDHAEPHSPPHGPPPRSEKANYTSGDKGPEESEPPPKPLTKKPFAQPPVKAIYAGLWNRFAASFIDSVIVVIGGFLPSLPFLIAEGMSTATTYPFWMILEFIVSLVIGWLYFTLLESSTKQATIGKMAVGIIVTDLNGKRIFFGRANGRYWGKVISFLILGIGYIMAGFTRKKQALHDIMADTLVLARPEGVRSWVTTTIIGGSIVILLVGISILVLNLQDVRDARDTQTAKPASAIKLFKPDRGNFGIWYDESKWLKTKQPDKEGKILFHLIGEDGYGMVISEGIGMPTTTLKEQALENALEAAPDAKIIFEENGVR